MMSRRGAERNQELEQLPADELVETLALAGMGGVILHPDAKKPLAAQVDKILKDAHAPRIESSFGDVFYDLRPYAESLKGRYPPEGNWPAARCWPPRRSRSATGTASCRSSGCPRPEGYSAGAAPAPAAS